MKKLCLVIITTCIFAIPPTGIFAQESEKDYSKFFEYQKSFERFNDIAASNADKLIFKLLQFKAPYGGVYQETYVSKEGKAVSYRMTPYARQAGNWADLTDLNIKEINRQISILNSNVPNEKLEPINGQLYSTLIFNDGQKVRRYDFVGQIPAELKSILDFLKVEFEKADKLEMEKFAEEGRILKEKYGDWQNKIGLLRSTSDGASNLKFSNTVLKYLKGLRQPIKDNRQSEIPIYYALIFYPEGRLTGGATGKGNRSDNPIYSSGVTWTLSEKTNKGEEIKKELLLTYNAIDETLRIEGKVYQLGKGNLLVIKMNNQWQPETVQLNVYLDKAIEEREVIMEFEKKLNVNLLQFPEQ
jgi:hypothetical protein